VIDRSKTYKVKVVVVIIFELDPLWGLIVLFTILAIFTYRAPEIGELFELICQAQNSELDHVSSVVHEIRLGHGSYVTVCGDIAGTASYL